MFHLLFFFNRFGIYQRVFLLIASHSRLQWSAWGSVWIFIAPFDLCSVKCFMIQNSQYLVHDTVISQGERFVHKEQAETTCVLTTDNTGRREATLQLNNP